MAKKVEVEKLLEGLTFGSDEQRQAFESLLADEKNHETLSRRYLRRDEGSRLAQEAQTKIKEADERIKAEDAYHQTLSEFETKIKGDVEAKGKYEAYLKSLGLDPAKALAGEVQTVPGAPPPPAVPQFDAAKFDERYVDRNTVAQATKLLIDLPFQLQIVQQKHFELYGKPAPADKLLEMQQEYVKSGRPFQEIAADSFHFADRTQELAKEQMTKDAEKVAEERFQKLVQEHGLPTPQTNSPTALVFTNEFAQVTPGANPGQPTQNEIARFNEVNAELQKSGTTMFQQ